MPEHLTENQINNRISQIDFRVSRLEKINDDWISRKGEVNEGIMILINDLMNERDQLKQLLTN